MNNNENRLKCISVQRVYGMLVRALDGRINELGNEYGHPGAEVEAFREVGASDEELEAFGIPIFGCKPPPYIIPKSPERYACDLEMSAVGNELHSECLAITGDEAISLIRFFKDKANAIVDGEHEVWERMLVNDLVWQLVNEPLDDTKMTFMIGGPNARRSGYAVGIYSAAHKKHIMFESDMHAVCQVCQKAAYALSSYSRQDVDAMRTLSLKASC